MVLITHRPARRFFAFGCSFTNYQWMTWPEIIAFDLRIPQYFNLGKSGGGNEFIFNRVMQVDEMYDINENDLVMICWTNVTREDRYLKNEWVTPGNVYTQNVYDDSFVKKFYADPENLVLHDFAFIHAVRRLLESKKCTWHFLQMLPIFSIFNQWKTFAPKNYKFNQLIASEAQHLNPSFNEVLWQNDINIKRKAHCIKYVHDDLHPSPLEHFKYLDTIFQHEWQEDTRNRIQTLEAQYDSVFNRIKSEEDIAEDSFDHLRVPDDLPRIF